MAPSMNERFWRPALVVSIAALMVGIAILLVGCGNKETKEALEKSNALEAQKQYFDANTILVDALQAREAKIRADAGTPADSAATDALSKKVSADPEILRMERAQIPLYLHLERADMASAVYTDILGGSPGDTIVYDLLHDPDAVIRMGAVRILGLEAKPDAINALTAALKDADQNVRRAAVVALGAIKDTGSVEPLIGALKDSYWDARSEAANALGLENDGRAIKPLLDAVGDSDSTVRTSAETALLFLCNKPSSSMPADDFATRLNDPNPKLVVISAVCLALLKDPRAVPVLLKLVDSTDPTARLDAIKGLGETGDPSVIPILRQTLKDPDVNMRGWSIIGLGSLKDQASLPDLQAISADTTQPASIRNAALASISKITGQPPAPSAGP